MKKVSVPLLLTILLLLLSQASLQAIIFLDRTGFYLAGSASYDWNVSCDCSLGVQNGGIATFKDGSVRPDSSFNANLSLGYYMDQWRIEAEGNYRNNKGNANFSLNGITVKDFGFLSEFSAMANVYYDIPMTPCSGFYLGAGVGAGFSEIEISGLINDSVEDTRFAYQIMAGLFYKLNCAVAVTLGYRFFGTTSPEETTFYGNGVTASVTGDDSPIIQSVELGMRISL